MFAIAAPVLPPAAARCAAVSGLPTFAESACAAAGVETSAAEPRPSAAATERRETNFILDPLSSSMPQPTFARRALRSTDPAIRGKRAILNSYYTHAVWLADERPARRRGCREAHDIIGTPRARKVALSCAACVGPEPHLSASATYVREGSAHEPRIRVSGPRQPGGRHGPRACRREPGRARGVSGGRRGAGPATVEADVRRARGRAGRSPRTPSPRSWRTRSPPCACWSGRRRPPRRQGRLLSPATASANTARCAPPAA